MLVACIACQLFVVLFMALHDWIPLGVLNNLDGIRASDSKARLLVVTAISTLPFAIALAGTVACALGVPAGWAKPWAVVSYALVIVGVLRAWWIPYLFAPNPERAVRHAVRFAGTHAFLPPRNGIRPDTLHVVFHGVAVATLVLACLAKFR